MKRPAFQFYPGDWLMDSSLRCVTVAARGVWIDMLCLMHQAEPYGHLKVNGKVILPVNLARIVGATLPDTEGYLGELEDAGVFSRDESGCIFSRRMIRDEKLRQVRAAGGKLGGNPSLKDAQVRLGGRLTLEDKQKPTPSSSSSSSSKEQKNKPAIADVLQNVSPQIADDFRKLRKDKKAPITKTAVDGIKREAAKAGMSLDEALAMCCERGWSGFKADWVSSAAKPAEREVVSPSSLPFPK